MINIGGKSRPVYKFSARLENIPDDVPPVSETEIDRVLCEFASMCKVDPLLSRESDEVLHEEFLERLLHTESMRLLSRRDEPSLSHNETRTLSLRRGNVAADEQRILRLDFYVAQYLIDLQSKKPELFNTVSDIAFANMAAEALACFSGGAEANGDLSNLTVYLDSPLLLDILGVNAEYAGYGNELLQMIKDSGAVAAVFDDCIAEAESVVAAALASHNTGIAQRIAQWKTAARPHVLAALQGNVASLAVSRGIAVQPDPDTALLQRSSTTVGNIQTLMTQGMLSWPNEEARKHDERSVWAMLRKRTTTEIRSKVSESKAIFVARNTALIRIANKSWHTWLKETTRFSHNAIERSAPVAMSDKQLAGYLWLQKGQGNGTMSKARLLAHCSAAIRPRPDIKAKAYNLIFALHGKQEAEIVGALFEDKDGERALMRVTHANPEDVTSERLPYIIEMVKREAGEFAAQAAREEEQEKLRLARLEHEQEVERLKGAAEVQKTIDDERARAMSAELAQRDLDQEALERKISTMRDQKVADEQAKSRIINEKLRSSFDVGRRACKRLKFMLVILFGTCSLWVSTNATSWPTEYQLFSTFLLTCIGFWFVPEYLQHLVNWHGRMQMGLAAERLGVKADLPSARPDFRSNSWEGVQLQ